MSSNGPTPIRQEGDESSAPPAPQGRPRDKDRATRKPLSLWDRSKILLFLLIAFALLVWSNWSQYQPIQSLSDAFRLTLRSFWWVILLAALELGRQIHYGISERRAGYHRFWTQRIFGGFERRTARLDAWNRHRVSRALKWLFALFLLDLILAQAYHTPVGSAIFRLPVAIFKALPLIAQIVFILSIAVGQFAAIFWFLSRGGVQTYMPDDIDTRYEDVKGQDQVLKRVKENVIYLENPEAIEAKGGYVPGGILLWGPPGTGKTLMAQAVAGETGRPFVSVEPAAFTNMFFGVGVLKVKALYRKLRRLSLRHNGVIVFFDEADSLGNRGSGGQGGWTFRSPKTLTPWSRDPTCNGLSFLSRDTITYLFHQSLDGAVAKAAPGKDPQVMAGMMGGAGMGTLQSLLSEMDGLKKPRGFFNRIVRRALGLRPKPPPKYRILHIFATNMPEALDEAMLRPGRIDRIYKVGYPSREGRRATFQLYLGKVKHDLTETDVDKLSLISAYATGATIKDMVNEALAVAIRDDRDTIRWPDMIHAKHLKEHGLPDDTEYIERERHAVAIHEACHAVVAYRLRKHALIDMATIERRGDVGGFVSFIPPEDIFVNWKSEYDIDIMCSIASLAGERLFFEDDNSAGVAGDLANATAVATRMEAYLGMGNTLASHYVTKSGLTRGRALHATEDGTDRNLLETELGRRVEDHLRALLTKTEALLQENRSEVLAVAHALETHKTMSGDDVAAIIDGESGPLVDGRPYREAAFVESAELYHVEAVAAHKSHSKPTMPLPSLPALVGNLNGEGDRAPAVGNSEIPRPGPDEPLVGETRPPDGTETELHPEE